MAALANKIRPFAAGSSAEVFWTGAIPIEPLSLCTAEAGAVGETCASVSATKIRQSGGSRPEQAASCNAPGAGEGGRETAQGYSAATEAPLDSGSRSGGRNAAACRDGAGASAEPGRNRGHLAVTSLAACGSSPLPVTGREEDRHLHSLGSAR